MGARFAATLVACSTAAIVMAATPLPAAADDVTIPVRVYTNKAGSKTKLVSKGSFALPDPGIDNPTVSGAAIVFGDGTSIDSIALPAANWSALGNPAGSKGFKYSDPSGATCKRILIRPNVIKALCKATAAGAPPIAPGSTVDVVLSIGSGQRYCAECPNGGTASGNPERITKFKDCGAPAVCALCGDDIVEDGEQCDGSDAAACPGFCEDDCSCSSESVCCSVPFMTLPFQQTCLYIDPATCIGDAGTPFAGGVCNLVTGGCHDPSNCGGSGPACDGACPDGGTCVSQFGDCICSAGTCGSVPSCGDPCPGEYLCGELPFTGICGCYAFP